MFENEFDFLFQMLRSLSTLLGTWPFFSKKENVNVLGNVPKVRKKNLDSKQKFNWYLHYVKNFRDCFFAYKKKKNSVRNK